MRIPTLFKMHTYCPFFLKKTYMRLKIYRKCDVHSVLELQHPMIEMVALIHKRMLVVDVFEFLVFGQPRLKPTSTDVCLSIMNYFASCGCTSRVKTNEQYAERLEKDKERQLEIYRKNV